jgi:dipeptidyl aminopeptidase/acylaminoacyl peptidase
MFRTWIAAFAAALLCAALGCAAPLEAYGTLPTLSDVTLSPDGNSIAYVRFVKDKRVVVSRSLKTGEFLGLVNVSQTKLRGLRWADNHTLLITTSMTALPFGMIGHREEFNMAQSFDVETKVQHPLLEHAAGADDLDAMNVVAGAPLPRLVDGHTYVFVPGIYFPNDTGRLGLFRIDLATNQTRMVSNRKDTNVEDWAVDDAGNIVAESSYYERDQRWKLVIFANGERITAMDVAAPIESPSLEGLNEDATAIIVSVPGPDGTPTYQQVSLKDGAATPWQHANVAFGDIMTDRRGRVVGGSRMSDSHDYVFFDPHAEMIWRSVKAAFKEATDVELVSWTDDRNKVVVHVFGPAYGDRYFLVDMATHKAEPVGPEYDGIADVAPVKWIDYKAGDGRKINAYLTLPLKREAKNLPLIVLPHGGPHARDEPGFDWMSQAFASRGYAVLQPQFRGSDGFGLELLAAGYGEFGKKMQTDLSDGVRALAAQGLIDPKRVCIVGASYGGYAALAGATLDTGLYRCAVSIAGLSDLSAQLEYWHWPRNTVDARGERFWDRFLGVSDPDDKKLDAISPIKHVDKVTIPILLIHGKDDTVVPYAQSDDMADALKAAKKPYEFVTLKAEDHWLSKSETRLQMLQATVKFLETNNPPDPPAAPSGAEKPGSTSAQH